MGDMNVCTKYNRNLLSSCLDVLLKTTNVNHVVTLKENSGDHLSHQDSSSEKKKIVCMGVHPVEDGLFLVKTESVNQQVALEENLGDHQS